MVNQNKGLEYNPIPVYNRGLIRSVLRHRVEKKNGLHNVNGYMSAAFKRLKEEKE